MFPILTGKLLDAFEKSGNARGGYAILFTICGFAYIVAFVLHHLLAPRFEQIDAPDVGRGFAVIPADANRDAVSH
jgi:ACS family hexuronate transporter-like MFS transporter